MIDFKSELRQRAVTDGLIGQGSVFEFLNKGTPVYFGRAVGG